MLKYVWIIVVFFSFLACAKKKAAKQAKKDESTIQKYIGDHGLNATATGSGLYYIISTQGTGASPDQNAMVTVSYTGTLTDGTIFDASTPTGASFQLSGVIKGWQEGMPYFKKGGKGKLLIPSALGYGSQGSGSIPPNAVLIFDINLIDVK
jgi:FKBP-type peptidyl-prolyl cis-trans isomerase FkpA